MVNLQNLAFKNVESLGTYKRKGGEKGRSLEKEKTKEKKKGQVGRGEEGGAEPNKIGIIKTKVPLPRQQPHESSSGCSSFRECEGQMSTYPQKAHIPERPRTTALCQEEIQPQKSIPRK